MRRFLVIMAALLWGMSLAGCASVQMSGPADPDDPFERANRGVFEASMKADRYVVLPAAKLYRHAIPRPIRESIRHFLNNLNSPVIFTNDVLQGQIERAGITAARFGINTTFGVGGIFEVAEGWGLPRHDEDFGQTLAVWGVGEGPYLFLPVIGPGNPRDLAGWGVDFLFDPLTFVHWGDKWPVPYVRYGIDMIDVRERNIETLDDVQKTTLDFYASIRSLYRQTRNNEIRNGETQVQDLPNF